MTRINVVPPAELCDQHLLAEYRELTRIPNRVAKGPVSLEGQPADYVLGTGHVRFFYDKLLFLRERYDALCNECWARGFNVGDRWPDRDPARELPADDAMWKDYAPTSAALAANRVRIAERMPKSPRFTPHKGRLNVVFATGDADPFKHQPAERRFFVAGVQP